MNKTLIDRAEFTASQGKPTRLFSVNKMVSITLLMLVIWQWGSAGWIFAKARLAQWLIAESWAETLATGQGEKPWPWADTFPIARLQWSEQDIDLYILEGAQGNSLAFGPGHLQGTALPGEGMSVIGGHRDTHFHFLKDIKPGAIFELERSDGRRISYRLATKEIVDSRSTLLYVSDSQGSHSASSLILVTCYPFDSINPDGPLRMVARAYEVSTKLSTNLFTNPSTNPPANLTTNVHDADIVLDYVRSQQTVFSL